MDPNAELDLVHWLAEASLAGTDEPTLLAEVCRRLRGAGVPVDRGFTGVELIHPLLEGEIFHWNAKDDTVRRHKLDRFDEDRSAWLSSPLYTLHSQGAPMLRRRVGESYRPGEFPLIDDLVTQGVTDYVALMGRFGGEHAIGERDETFITFSTMDPAGFSDDDVAVMRRIKSNLVGALSVSVGRRTAYAIMECYLGRDAGRRVLRGGIERGVAEEIEAVLWFSDLRGFTSMVDTMAPEEIIPMLNAYAAAQANAVQELGGEILKFVGDGVLAIFPRSEIADACNAALDAAVQAFEGTAKVKAQRQAAGKPATDLYLGLHVGKVLYGNIGSAERLDFTVVGPAVNEVNRIAGMCKPLEKEMLVSSAFAQAAPEASHRLVAMGRYALRGVRMPQMLYTLDPTAPGNKISGEGM